MKQSHNTRILCGSLPGGETMSIGTVFYYILREYTQFCCNLLCSLRSSRKLHAHSQKPFSLRSLLLLYFFLLQYTLPLSLSQSLWIVTFMLKESATGYSKITTDLRTKLELNSFSMSYYLTSYYLTI